MQPNKIEKKNPVLVKTLDESVVPLWSVIKLKCNKPKSSRREKIKNIFPQGVR